MIKLTDSLVLVLLIYNFSETMASKYLNTDWFFITLANFIILGIYLLWRAGELKIQYDLESGQSSHIISNKLNKSTQEESA